MFSERELRGRIDRQFRSNDDFRQLRGQLEIVSLDDRLQWESWKWPINEIAEDFAASYSDYSCSNFTFSFERRSNSNNPNFVGNIFQRWGRFFLEIYQNKNDILLIIFSLHSSKLDVYSNTCMSFLTRARTRDRFHEAWAHTMTIGSRLVSSQNKRPFEILP